MIWSLLNCIKKILKITVRFCFLNFNKTEMKDKTGKLRKALLTIILSIFFMQFNRHQVYLPDTTSTLLD